MTSIAIFGIGGVGGYFGGLLAKAYAESTDVQINFIARGKHMRSIKEHGLIVEDRDETFTAHPHTITDDIGTLAPQDYVIICTKTYHLDAVCEQLEHAIDEDTVILTLLNGVDSVQKLTKRFPNNVILNGCAYIYAKIKATGVIDNFGMIEKVFFGHNDGKKPQGIKFYDILHNANIDVTHSKNILKRTWSKYLLISSIATACSYHDKPIKYVIEHHQDDVSSLMDEIIQLASLKGITLDEDLKEKTIARLAKADENTTASMHRDFIQDRTKTEVESLTGYVLKEGERFGVEAPTYKRMYIKLN